MLSNICYHAKIKECTGCGRIAYHIAAEFGHVNIMEYFESVDDTSEYSQTALHFAAGQCHTNIVFHLLRKQANPNAKNTTGNTPRHDVCASPVKDREKLPIVELLLQNGADVSIKNTDGKLAIDLISDNGESMKSIDT